MKKLITIILCIFASAAIFAQHPELTFTEATELTIVGKVFPDTPNPYERMDFTKYGGWEKKDINLLEMSSGIIVSFKTNSPEIYVKPEFKEISNAMSSGYAARGFDLYIKRDGKWLWAGDCVYGFKMVKTLLKNVIISRFAPSCLSLRAFLAQKSPIGL